MRNTIHRCTVHVLDFFYSVVPDADLEVTPDSIDILDFPPHNSIRITCAVSISEHINVPFMFKWLVNQVQLTDGSDGVSIKENGMSSVLISAPTSSGTLVYTCQFYLTFPHPDLPLMLFSNATVNIQGNLEQCMSLSFNVGIFFNRSSFTKCSN